MKIKTKTNELIGPSLDWAVAECEGETTVHLWQDPLKMGSIKVVILEDPR